MEKQPSERKKRWYMLATYCAGHVEHVEQPGTLKECRKRYRQLYESRGITPRLFINGAQIPISEADKMMEFSLSNRREKGGGRGDQR